MCKHLAAFYTLTPTRGMYSSWILAYQQNLTGETNGFLKQASFTSSLLQNNYKYCTFRRGLSLVSIMKSYLQSSQQRVSELLIHWWRQDWWTKRRVPVQRQGVMRGLSSSPSQWQILGKDTAARVKSPTNGFPPSFIPGCIRNCTLSFRRHGHFIPTWC